MRTGEFANKHNITHDTIRHYLKMGLLATKKDGGHYRFTEEDSNDIKKIAELKQLDFTLVEIQTILCFQRLAGEKTNEYRDHYSLLLEQKKIQIAKEQQRYIEMNIYLDEIIKELNLEDEGNRKTLGLPIPSISLLRCPDCKKSLDIMDGVIERNMLINANIKCGCNYQAIIQNGVYIDESAVRKKTGMDGNPLPTKKEYLEAASPRYINFLYYGMSMLINNIREHGRKAEYIMELDGCVGFFLMQYIEHLPKDSTYILIDYDTDRIASLKDNLEAHHNHKNFMFFCCDIDRLPIGDSAIDIIVDNCMTTNYGRTNDKLICHIVLPMLKQRGLITGTYPYFSPRSRDLKSMPENIRDYYCKDKLVERLMDLNVEIMDLADIGPISEDNPYSTDIKGKELYHAVYLGENRAGLKSTYIERAMKEVKIS